MGVLSDIVVGVASDVFSAEDVEFLHFFQGMGREGGEGEIDEVFVLFFGELSQGGVWG